MDGWTNRQTGGWMDSRQIDKQTDETGRSIDIQIDGLKNRQRDWKTLLYFIT
jgi:hypothetical protein